MQKLNIISNRKTEKKEHLQDSRCSCGKKAVIFRRYEGKFLCKNCFCQSIEKKFKRTVRKGNMIQPGDSIGIGVSGGKDSSVALYLMHKIISPRRDMELVAISIDEGISGYRPKSLEIAKRFCKKLGIKHKIYSFKKELGKTLDVKTKNMEKHKGEACTYCGVARRYILNKASRELKCTKLCVGHNLDDETQTIFMNYIRGDLSRASRVASVTDASTKKKKGFLFIPRIKPLREIPEKEVALYAMLKGLELDFDECPNASGIRFEVRDFLNNLEEKYPGIKFAVLETFDKIALSIRDSIEEKEGEIKECKICGEPSSHDICKTCELWRTKT